MKTNNTFSIMLLCRPSKKNTSEGLIYARITVNGEQTEISLKEKILVKQWNVLKQQVDGRSLELRHLILISILNLAICSFISLSTIDKSILTMKHR